MLPQFFATPPLLNNFRINHGYPATNFLTIKLCITTPKSLIGIFLNLICASMLRVAR